MSRGIVRMRAIAFATVIAALHLATPARSVAQFTGGIAGPGQPSNPRLGAPIDFTGYWVAVVTEDWRYRMITPDKGDYPGVPLNAEGQRVANSWDPAKDEASGEQCKSYGAAALMRVPTRLHITWQDDKTLRVETDAGTQTRLFHFGAAPAQEGAPSWQGSSLASWEGLRHGGFGNLPTVASGGTAPVRPSPEGYLKVMTTQMRPGYLRKNGVPYGANTTLEEYFDSFKEPNGDTWLVVTAVVTDPEYLTQSFVTSSQFKKQADAHGWNPTPCEVK